MNRNEAIEIFKGIVEFERLERENDPEHYGEYPPIYYAAEAAITILAELGRGAGVPAGWVLVPIEPNWDMRNEGREFLIDGLEKDYEKIAYFLWKTMVNASPKAPDTRPPVAGLAELTDEQWWRLFARLRDANREFHTDYVDQTDELHAQYVADAGREFLGKVE